MNGAADRERARFEDFYGRKWSSGPVLWQDGYPFDQRVYAVSLYRRRNEAILDCLPPAMDSALDLGCGAGDIALMLTERASRVAAVDLSFINAAATRDNATHADDELQVAQAESEALPFADEAFDAVVLADVIEHVGDIAHTLAEVRRVLKPKGSVVCVTPLKATLDAWRAVDWAIRTLSLQGTRAPLKFSSAVVRERFLGKRELRQMLEAQGFRIQQFQRVGFYPAPEIGGAFGSLMRRVAARQTPDRFRRTSDRVIAAFDACARLRIFNQKQLWVARR